MNGYEEIALEKYSNAICTYKQSILIQSIMEHKECQEFGGYCNNECAKGLCCGHDKKSKDDKPT